MDRINPAAGITFRDLLPDYVAHLPAMSQAEFDALPKSGPHGPSDGWEKTGYLQPNKLLLNHDLIFWVFVDFKRYQQVPGDFGYESRAETKQYLVHVDGDVVIQRKDPYS